MDIYLAAAVYGSLNEVTSFRETNEDIFVRGIIYMNGHVCPEGLGMSRSKLLERELYLRHIPSTFWTDREDMSDSKGSH